MGVEVAEGAELPAEGAAGGAQLGVEVAELPAEGAAGGAAGGAELSAEGAAGSVAGGAELTAELDVEAAEGATGADSVGSTVEGGVGEAAVAVAEAPFEG